MAGRTFATYKVKRFGPNAQCNCDITDGTNDQVYVGFNKEGGADGNRWVAAVNDTRGQVVTHRGNVIQAFYAASDGGHSDAVEDVWHGGNDAFAIPYLKAECDPGENTSANPWIDWQQSVHGGRADEPSRAVHRARSARCGASRGSAGRGRSHHHGDGRGAARLGRDHRLGAAVGDRRVGRAHLDQREQEHHRADPRPLRRGDVPPGSADVADPERARAGRASASSRGRSSATAAPASPSGCAGAIYREYKAIGGPKSTLGMPTSQIVDVDPGREAGRSSRGGRILAKPGAGAHALWGRVLDEYLDRGGTDGSLGFPTSRVRGDGSGGSLADFEHGTIVCPERPAVPARLTLELRGSRDRQQSSAAFGLRGVRGAGERLDEPVGDRASPARR